MPQNSGMTSVLPCFFLPLAAFATRVALPKEPVSNFLAVREEPGRCFLSHCCCDFSQGSNDLTYGDLANITRAEAVRRCMCSVGYCSAQRVRMRRADTGLTYCPVLPACRQDYTSVYTGSPAFTRYTDGGEEDSFDSNCPFLSTPSEDLPTVCRHGCARKPWYEIHLTSKEALAALITALVRIIPSSDAYQESITHGIFVEASAAFQAALVLNARISKEFMTSRAAAGATKIESHFDLKDGDEFLAEFLQKEIQHQTSPGERDLLMTQMTMPGGRFSQMLAALEWHSEVISKRLYDEQDVPPSLRGGLLEVQQRSLALWHTFTALLDATHPGTHSLSPAEKVPKDLQIEVMQIFRLFQPCQSFWGTRRQYCLIGVETTSLNLPAGGIYAR